MRGSPDLDALARRITAEFRAVDYTGVPVKAAKAQVESEQGYGWWGVWCEAMLPFSPRSAQLYMQLASAVPALCDPDADIERVLRKSPVARELAGLPLRQAMRRLAEPRARPPSPRAVQDPRP